MLVDIGATVPGMSTVDETPVRCCAPLAAPTMSDEEAATAASVFKALAEPARVRIINALANADGPVCGCDLEEPIGLSQPTISHHMKKLVEAGLVRREKHGTWAYYALDADACRHLAAVCAVPDLCVEPGGNP